MTACDICNADIDPSDMKNHEAFHDREQAEQESDDTAEQLSSSPLEVKTAKKQNEEYFEYLKNL